MQISANTDPYVKRSRYLTLDQGFNVGRAEVPARIFLAERDEALLANAPSMHILCDQSSVIGGEVPATAPLLLASYVRLKPGQPLELKSGGSAEIYYAIKGVGVVRWDSGEIAWQAGDVLLLPGGVTETFNAHGDANAVLWRCTNEPQLAYERARPAQPDYAIVQPTHYRGLDMMQALSDAQKLTMKNGMRSMAIMFGSASSNTATIAPSLTLALNSIPHNDSQVPHRHNSVAVSLVLKCDKCHSTVGGKKVVWEPYATFVTPGGASHAHHNESDKDALVLIVQDGGLYYHCRTMGFAITEA